MELITTSKEQADAIIASFGLQPVKITSIEKTGEKPVWDLSLLEEKDVPHSIITNGIITHNSSSPDYIENMMKSMNVKGDIQNIFGLRDDSGNWIVKPRVRYYQPGTAEAFFDSVAKLLRTLPDIKMVGEKQYYVYPDEKIFRAKVKDKLDEKLTKKTGMLYVPTESYVKHQALFIVDSYPAMLPEKQDEDDPGSAMAVQARMFSEQIKRIKSKLKPKKITIIGINQLRLRPMVMFGNPEYEPCGEALKLFCFHKDTMLFTSKGILTGELAYSVKPRFIASKSSKEKQENYSNMGIHPICKVQTELGYNISGRHEHKVYAIRQGSRIPDWVNLEDLTPEYYVAIKSGSNVWASNPLKLGFKFKPNLGQGTNQVKVVPKFPKRMTPELARLLGYLISEGHVREGRVIFSNTDKSIMFDYIECLKSVFGFDDEYIDSKKKLITHDGEETAKGGKYKKQYVLDIYSTYLEQFFNFIGINNKSSREKCIPWSILQSDKETIAYFIGALFSGDDGIGSKEIVYSSSSSKLIDQLQVVLLNFGIVTKVDNNKPSWLDKEFHFKNEYSFLKIYGKNISLFLNEIPVRSEQKEEILYNRFTIDKANLVDKSKCMPEVFYWREKNKKIQQAFLTKLKYDKNYGITNDRRHFTAEQIKLVLDELWKEANSYRTEQERAYSTKVISEIESLVNYTLDHNIIWSKVEKVHRNLCPETTYDCTMPETHTIITNGIISHNSDARIRCASRACPPPGKGQFEEEPSVTGEGIDTYRYVNWRAIKNKLGAPNLEGWGRIWVSDNEGKGRGFDPVWDCYEYLRMTGQVSGGRNKLLLNFPSFKGLKPKLNWMQLKTLVLGTKEQIAKVYNQIGYKDKPFNIRRECFKQFDKGLAMQLFFDKKVKNVEAKGDEEE
jgi:intein/homing endonuclease